MESDLTNSICFRFGLGFEDVIVEDRTDQFVQVLRRELERVEKEKEEFISDFSEEDYNDIVGGWKSKLERIWKASSICSFSSAQMISMKSECDERKAEEYCERAMLSDNGRDGEMLSMYGDLIWKNHRDSVRAQSYFDQAVQSSPHDWLSSRLSKMQVNDFV
ncbi:unnamed protein product [Arabis nemorensis]|uniref:phosphoethanolamine N-methyltransferase n=1 Tax=Arabis nemorensis TaxID=586526 RepID=A0A565CID2_9BRAS|nr:unnamed protein product [Arabis nemorensis]